MRIVGGELRGRRLDVPKGADFRPTSERVREAIFSSLGSMCELQGSKCLDLYAGSGALGIEALSRGALNLAFVEKNKRLSAAISENLRKLEVETQGRVHCSSVERFIAESKAKSVFDIVFADPPYSICPGTELVEQLMNTGLVVNESVLVYETSRDFEFGSTKISSGLDLSAVEEKVKHYGDTSVRYYRFC